MIKARKPRLLLTAILWMTILAAFGQQGPFHLYRSCDIISMSSFTNRIEQKESKDGALRFAHPYFVNLTPKNSGRWIELADGCRIWTLTLHSEGAKSINLIFDQFLIDPNSRLIVYSPYYEEATITFSSENHTPTGVLPTVPIPGDMVVVEYQQYKGCKTEPCIVIGAVNHDYLGVFGILHNNKAGRFGDSGECNPDITCAQEPSIIIENKSVCKIIVDGTQLCSGTLINNTLMDGTPYFLSAAHCFKKKESAFSTIYFFNYEVPACQNNIEGTKMQYITGGLMRAFVDTYDMALLEMNHIPEHSFQPYWAGWNLNEAPTAPYLSIHHPSGDVKKYAITKDPLIKSTFKSYTNEGVPFATDVHWLVKKWDTGTTEGGSSGCGIFDANNLLVGSLSGGDATCKNPQNDYFVRMNRAWNAGPNADQQLAHWLNPNNQAVQKLEGYNHYNKSMERVSYIKTTHNPSALRLPPPAIGFVAGHNSSRHTAFAQYFHNIVQAKIKGVFLVSGKSTNYSDQKFTIKVWRDNKGLPGEAIASINGIPVSTLKYNTETYYEFPNTIEIVEPFHLGVEISYPEQNIDSVALFVNKGTIGIDKNRLSINNGSRWVAYTELTETQLPVSLWIDLLATEVEKNEKPMPPLNGKLHLYPQQVSDGFSVMVESDTISTLNVYDMNGKPVITRTINGTSAYIACRNLPSGLYIVKVALKDGSIERKIIKLPN